MNEKIKIIQFHRRKIKFKLRRGSKAETIMSDITTGKFTIIFDVQRLVTRIN